MDITMIFICIFMVAQNALYFLNKYKIKELNRKVKNLEKKLQSIDSLAKE